MLPTRRRTGAAAWIVGELRDAGVEAQVSAAPAPDTMPGAAEDERTVDVEWIGERSLLDDPIVEYRLFLTRHGLPASGGLSPYTRHELAALEAAARMRIIPYPGHTRELTADRDGLSRDYRWGQKAGTTTIPVRFRDAEKIRASASGHEFRILGHEPPPSPVATGSRYLRLVNAAEFDGIARYVWQRTNGHDTETKGNADGLR